MERRWEMGDGRWEMGVVVLVLVLVLVLVGVSELLTDTYSTLPHKLRILISVPSTE
jgi:hypothetical protein